MFFVTQALVFLDTSIIFLKCSVFYLSCLHLQSHPQSLFSHCINLNHVTLQCFLKEVVLLKSTVMLIRSIEPLRGYLTNFTRADKVLERPLR